MNENIDLTKILEGCPQGTKFYSSIYGEVSFVEIKICFAYPIMLMSYGINQLPAGQICYAKDGNYNSAYNGECTLFPSKDQRDWAKFERFWDKPKAERFDPKTLYPFDKVLVRDEDCYWTAALFSNISNGVHGKVLVRDINTSDWYVDFFSNFNNQGEFICTSGCHWVMGIPYNEDTKHLVGTSKDCPKYYKWWEK